MSEKMHVAVVGGGLGGLLVANLAVRAGHDVTLVERSSVLGGRARSEERAGARLNLGAHAMYAMGALRQLLDELGVPYSGRIPSTRGALATYEGRLFALPVGVSSLLGTALFTLAEKLVAARLLARIRRGPPASARGKTLAAWLDEQALPARVRAFVEAAVRVSTYVNAPEVQDAAASLHQVALGGDGVLYLDGGWQTLVDSLEAMARRSGVRFVHEAARALVLANGRARGVVTQEGTTTADAVVLATGPREAAALAPESKALRRSTERLRAARVACLDLVVERLPVPERTVCLGLDEPLYFSVHSAAAALVDEPASVVCLAKYLPPDGEGSEEELMAFAERVQPGIKRHIRHAQLLPKMTVTHAVVSRGGLAARPRPEVEDTPGLFLVGDWVGDLGQLADGVAASAQRCAAVLPLAGYRAEVA